MADISIPDIPKMSLTKTIIRHEDVTAHYTQRFNIEKAEQQNDSISLKLFTTDSI